MKKWLVVVLLAAVLASGLIWHSLHGEPDSRADGCVTDLPQGARRVLTDLAAEPTDVSRQREAADWIWVSSTRALPTAQHLAAEARGIAPRSGIVAAASAYLSFVTGERKQALSQAKQAARLGGLDGDAHLQVGFVLWQLGRADTASDHLASVVTAEPSLGEALLFVHISVQIDEEERAVAVLREAALGPSQDAVANALVQGLVIVQDYDEAASLSASLHEASVLHWSTVPSATFAAVQTERMDLAEEVMDSPGGGLSHHGLTHHRLAFAAVAASKDQTQRAWDALRVSLAMIYAGEDSQSTWSEHTRLPVSAWPAAPTFASFWGFFGTLQRSNDPYAEQIRGVGLLYDGQPEAASEAFRHALSLKPRGEPAATYVQHGSLEPWLESLLRLRETPPAGDGPREDDGGMRSASSEQVEG